MEKLNYIQKKGIAYCDKLIHGSQIALELINTCPINKGYAFITLGAVQVNIGTTYDAVVIPKRYNSLSMNVTVIACSTSMKRYTSFQYLQFVAFKMWEPSMAPLTINWSYLSDEYKAIAFNT